MTMVNCVITPNITKSVYQNCFTKPSLFSSMSIQMPPISVGNLLLEQTNNSTALLKRQLSQMRLNSKFTNQNATSDAQSIEDKSVVQNSPHLSNNGEDQLNSSTQTSLLLIRNSQNKIFKLTFRAVNTHLIPLYTKSRTFTDKENDKKCQPYSKSQYIEEYTPHLIRFNTTRKDFKINHRKDGRVSVMTIKRKLGKIMKKEPLPFKPPPSISANKSNLQKPVLYITVKNIHFHLNPKVMTMDFCKPLADQISNSFTRDLGLETVEQKKNKGSIIACWRGDILKFSFTLADINYLLISEVMSRSCDVKDDSVYIRKISSVTDRIVQVPLPRNIYNYKDPMVEIKRKNEHLKLKKIEPRWMFETRKSRLALNKNCQQADPSQKAYEATNGSSIVYEGPGTLNKAREGLIPCRISSEDIEKYEKWVIISQKDYSSPVPIEGDSLETYDANSTQAVPDWDLIVYTK